MENMIPPVESRQTNEVLSPEQSLWKAIGAHLEHARLLVQEEITHYPPPIPACDADFNHLLEERARIGEELNRMQSAARKNLSSAEFTLIEEFVRSSNFIDDEARQEIATCLIQLRNMQT